MTTAELCKSKNQNPHESHVWREYHCLRNLTITITAVLYCLFVDDGIPDENNQSQHVSSGEERRAHNPEDPGSKPGHAILFFLFSVSFFALLLLFTTFSV